MARKRQAKHISWPRPDTMINNPGVILVWPKRRASVERYAEYWRGGVRHTRGGISVVVAAHPDAPLHYPTPLRDLSAYFARFEHRFPIRRIT